MYELGRYLVLIIGRSHLLGAVLLLMPSILLADGSEWNLRKESDGIKAYTRQMDGTPHLAFRGVAVMNTSIARLVDIHRNVAGMPDWLHSCYDPVVVRDDGELSRVIHMKNSVPAWSRMLSLGAVSHRDLVLKQSIRFIENGAVVIDLVGTPEEVDPEPGFVRVPYFVGAWRFNPIDAEIVEVSYEGVIDPGGYLPAAVTNAMVVDVPFETLKKLSPIAKLDNTFSTYE